MKLTHRQLEGMIAGNPGNYAGLGEWRYCHDCAEPFFARASKSDAGHARHRWTLLPAMDPEGQDRLTGLFRRFIHEAFTPERQAELETFARRRGWDMALEYQAGGGALTAEEVDRWREVVKKDMEQLIQQAERIIAEGQHA